MNLNNLTVDEVLGYIEKGIVEEVPAHIVMQIFEEAYVRGAASADEFNGC